MSDLLFISQKKYNLSFVEFQLVNCVKKIRSATAIRWWVLGSHTAGVTLNKNCPKCHADLMGHTAVRRLCLHQ